MIFRVQPTEYMPAWAVTFNLLNILVYIIGIARCILLKGSGLRDVLRPVLVLLGTAVAENGRGPCDATAKPGGSCCRSSRPGLTAHLVRSSNRLLNLQRM